MKAKMISLDQMENTQGGSLLCASVGFAAGVVTANPIIGLGFTLACMYAHDELN